jgi:hypothetical protein
MSRRQEGDVAGELSRSSQREAWSCWRAGCCRSRRREDDVAEEMSRQREGDVAGELSRSSRREAWRCVLGDAARSVQGGRARFWRSRLDQLATRADSLVQPARG